MRIGCTFPHEDIGNDPSAIRDFAQAAENLGFSHIMIYDHVLGAVHAGREPRLEGPYTELTPFHEAFVTFGFLAAVTTRIELTTGIVILPQRQTVLVAKQATDVELLSGGRLVLGVGIGWNYVEYDALGEEFSKRGARMDEQIPYLRRLWSEHAFSFDGKFDVLDRANIIPRPRTSIPIFCGGLSEPAYRRAAKYCDGFMFGGAPVEELKPVWDNMLEMVRKEGRDPAAFTGHTYLMGPNFAGADVQVAADSIRRWEDMGGTEVSIVTMGRGFKEVDQHLDHYQAVLAKAR